MSSYTKYLILPLCLLLFACGGEKRPENVLSPEQMVQVTADMQILSAIHQRRMYKMKNFNEYDLKSYRALFDKHGLTAEDYKRSLSYYKDYPETLIKIHDEVLIELSKRQALVDQVPED
ncbi:MAG: DUF4296 domain-containing protein [Bacteroidota bacterium]